MADYSFTPQFANLAGLQPLQAIDVTRGGALQFQPLQAIEVPSARPELVGQSIAGAIQNIAGGALSGITAKYEEKKAAEREQLEHERQMELYGAKKRSENEDFYQKQRALFIANHANDPRLETMVAEFDKGMERLRSATPDVKPVTTEKAAPISTASDVEAAAIALDTEPLPTDGQPSAVDLINQPPPPAAGINFGFNLAEEKRKALEEVPPTAVVSENKKPTAPLALLTTEETTAIPSVTPTPTATPAPKEKKITEVDYTEYPQPPSIDKKFKTDAEALNKAAEMQKQYGNKDYEYQVINLGKDDLYKTVIPVSKRAKRIEDEQKAVSSAKEEERALRSEQREQEKLDIAKAKEAREKAESEQQMQIRQQKVKDENKTLADHVETAATSLRELDDIISTIQNNPWSVGKMSAIYSKLPIDTDAAKVRAKLEAVGSNVAVNALTAMRQASPTGAAVGNTSDKEMSMFRATEGSFDPDNLQAKDILRVLREIKRKRLDVYNNSVNILKQNNPEYTPPEIKYPKETKQKGKSKSDEDMVSVVSPDGKSGRIPKSQLEQALTEGYKLKQ